MQQRDRDFYNYNKAPGATNVSCIIEEDVSVSLIPNDKKGLEGETIASRSPSIENNLNTTSDNVQSPKETKDRVSNQGRRSTSQLETISLNKFHVLIWIALSVDKQGSVLQTNGVQTSDGFGPASPELVQAEASKKVTSDPELLRAYLSSLHSWLQSQKDRKAKDLYINGVEKTFREVERAIPKKVNEATRSVKMDLFNSVKTIFQLFLPLEEEGVMCWKIWGAVYTVITVSDSNEIYGEALTKLT